ncbi:hypothetical protein R1flu_020243 [Riccia fluitans]|uniref:Uncharacterized protein n=1 Tax=Riccia fluitans TaxID=41844 RepID=A0ABD1ZMF1_9MARC
MRNDQEYKIELSVLSPSLVLRGLQFINHSQRTLVTKATYLHQTKDDTRSVYHYKPLIYVEFTLVTGRDDDETYV